MSFMENKYPFSTIVDAIKFEADQRRITSWLKLAKKIVETQIGSEIELPKLVKLDPKWMEIYDPAVHWNEQYPNKCNKRAYKKFTTYFYLENVDRSKYDTLLSGVAIQYSLGPDQYPNTVEETTNVLLNHKFDQAYYDNNKNRDQLQSNQ